MIKKLLRQSVNLIPWKMRDQIRRVPGLAALQRWVVRQFISGESFVHEINAGPGKGLKVMIRLPEDKGLWTGTYETFFVGAIATAVKVGSTCLDIGSYHGFVGGVMAQRGAAKVVCFEPLPQNVAVIKGLIGLNPRLNLTVRAEAVGNQDGTTAFEIMPQGSMGKLAGSTFQTGCRGVESVSIPVRSLDSLLAEGAFSAPNLIKIDVEGAETSVLAGACKLLTTGNPVVFIEAHSVELEKNCKRMLHEAGYEVEELAGSGASSLAQAGVSHLKAWKKK
jgi:FkbM family methyltransferase